MRWFSIYKQLAAEMDKNSQAASSLRENDPLAYMEQIQQLYDCEPENRALIDEACKQFARTNGWPKMGKNQLILAHVRVGSAAQFAKFLALDSEFFPNQFEDSQKASLLEFLLIDYWKFSGNARWRTT
jgi:hypothetical protein